MHRSLPAGSRFFVAAQLLVQAACDGGGGVGRPADPDELQIRVVAGDGMRAPVRPFGEQPTDSLVRRDRVHGQPVHETQQRRAARFFTSRKPGIIEGSPGPVTQATPRGFEGGTLCPRGPAGRAWGRTSPVLTLRP
jgi:hypothetical protein